MDAGFTADEAACVAAEEPLHTPTPPPAGSEGGYGVVGTMYLVPLDDGTSMGFEPAPFDACGITQERVIEVVSGAESVEPIASEVAAATPTATARPTVAATAVPMPFADAAAANKEVEAAADRFIDANGMGPDVVEASLLVLQVTQQLAEEDGVWVDAVWSPDGQVFVQQAAQAVCQWVEDRTFVTTGGSVESADDMVRTLALAATSYGPLDDDELLMPAMWIMSGAYNAHCPEAKDFIMSWFDDAAS